MSASVSHRAVCQNSNNTCQVVLCTSQFQLRSPPPPPPAPFGQLQGICTDCQFRRSVVRLPQGYPRAFDTHVVSDSKYKHGGVYRKRPVVCYQLACMSKILCIFSLLFKPQLELSLSIHCIVIGKDQREFVFRIQNVCDDIPGVGHLPSFFAQPPGKGAMGPAGID